ncbi:MAG TPA: HAD family phosphatase [Candidatus Acidoferrales bacterium]|jgi:FMN phosphatase YigB (HAD superfamily)|nr:HAD family phosphatase [Candidatus Acidoferrales bacterium]
MNNPPVFIFDLGKVLVDFDYSIAARKIAARSTKAPEDLHAFLGATPLLVEYESGRLTRQAFYDAICEAIDFRGDLVEFGSYFADIFSEMPGTIALHAELRQHGYKSYIFSNTNDLAIEHVRRNFPFFANFDGYIYSYEVGAMKPETTIYEAMEKMSDRRGADLIYIDDRPENIAAGAARNWRTILHESPEKTRQVLKKFSVL